MLTEGTFNSAKKNLEAKVKTGLFETKSSKVNGEFDKITAVLNQKGREGCGQVLTALEGAGKGVISLNDSNQSNNQPKIAAAPGANKQETHTASLGNITAYASGSVRAQQMKEMGL